jgi:hypothetical protein
MTESNPSPAEEKPIRITADMLEPEPLPVRWCASR